ncbi:hypothetical protein IGK73_002300 [Enterococcus sp. AZ102]
MQDILYKILQEQKKQTNILQSIESRLKDKEDSKQKKTVWSFPSSESDHTEALENTRNSYTF